MWALNNKQFTNDQTACVYSCIQEQVLSKCRCVTTAFPASKQKINWTETPFCQELVSDVKELQNKSICMKEVTDNVLSSCYSECQPECYHYRHLLTTANIMWPMNDMQLSFYNDVIKGKPFEKEFEIYANISKMASSGNDKEAKRLLRETSLIRENFAKTSVFLGNKNLVIIEDRQAMSLTDLLASLGGTLNLYSGISFILIVEAIDLLYGLFFVCPDKKEVEQSNGPSRSVEPSSTSL